MFLCCRKISAFKRKIIIRKHANFGGKFQSITKTESLEKYITHSGDVLKMLKCF